MYIYVIRRWHQQGYRLPFLSSHIQFAYLDELKRIQYFKKFVNSQFLNCVHFQNKSAI